VPWKETRIVDQRVQFIAALQQQEQESGRSNFARTCRRFGISRDTGYKWLARYELEGPSGLADRRPIAQRCPHRVADAIEGHVVELRKQWPHYGPKKLREAGLPGVPATSTIGDILERNGLVRPRRRRIRVAGPADHVDKESGLRPHRGEMALEEERDLLARLLIQTAGKALGPSSHRTASLARRCT
jgi:hypothetical protein